MKKIIFIVTIVLLLSSCRAHTKFVLFEQDRTKYDLTEWIDGEEWVYQDNGNFWVGVTMNDYEDGMFKGYYRLKILVQNHSQQTVLFDPDSISAKMVTGIKNPDGGYYWNLPVYGGDLYGKLAPQYNRSIASDNFPGNISSDSPQNGTIIHSLGSMIDDERRMQEDRYLKKATIYPGKGILGFLFTDKYIRNERGKVMLVDIPVGGDVFSFQWMMLKK